jgi:hypothetical protein
MRRFVLQLRVCREFLCLALPAVFIAFFSHRLCADVLQVPVAVQPDDFSIRCHVTDPATGDAIASLIPGDLARASAAIKIGETIMAGKITITGTASAALYGYDLKLKLGQTALEIPPIGQRGELLQLYATEPSTWPASFGQRFSTDFTVPNEWPRSRVTIKLVASVEGVGSRSCSKTLDIL